MLTGKAKEDKPIHDDPWNRAVFFLRKNGCYNNPSFVTPNTVETIRVYSLLRQCKTAVNSRPKRDLQEYLDSIGAD